MHKTTIMRALVWKEWRESWWLLALTVIAPAAALSALMLFDKGKSNYEIAVSAAVALFGPGTYALFAGVLAARLFASETARGTAHFQAERPVERGTVWNAKLLLPSCALAISLALYSMVCLFNRATLFAVIPEMARENPGQISPVILEQIALHALFVTMALNMFSCTTLFSMLMDRPITALATGGVATVVLALLPFWLLWPATFTYNGEALVLAGFAALTCVEAALLLVLSRAVYCRCKG